MSQPLIDLQHISKSFDGEMVLDDLNLSIKENSFVTLLGPSGCGKSTTLRILGGFTPPDKGNVIFDGQDITKLPPNKRQLNTVFQKYALFPHMTIAENIAFGLKIKNKPKSYIDDKIKYALKLVNLLLLLMMKAVKTKAILSLQLSLLHKKILILWLNTRAVSYVRLCVVKL